MSWARLDDRYPRHPKVQAAGPMGMCLDVAGICYSADHASDGFVPEVALPTLLAFATRRQHEQAAAKLVAVGRWQRDDERGGWWIHDFLEYNPTAASRNEQREAATARTQRWRNRRRGGDASTRDGVTSQRDADVTLLPSRENQKPKGQASGSLSARDPSPDPAAASPAGSSQAAADLAAEPQNNGQPATAAQKALLRAALERREPQPKELSAEEGRQLFDQRARQFLGMSGEEFVRRYDAGELDPDADDDVCRMAMLLPFWRDERRQQDADAEEVNEP
jgi:hypothetical protein